MKILTVFNRYLERGGEALAVDAISESLSQFAETQRCEFSSHDWIGPGAPNHFQQAAWMIKNRSSLAQLRKKQAEFNPDVWLFHNVFPVGSAAIYQEATRLGLPIIQYLHNFRPFSVNGYLWAASRIVADGLVGNFWPEIKAGAWQDSKIKTAWFALVLSLSWRLGWWKSVKAWVAISEFQRQKFIEAGIPTADIFTLPHFWNPAPFMPPQTDGEHYLFLGRLIESKGIFVLLEAWKIIEQRLGRRAPQLVIGGEGPIYASVKARAAQMEKVTIRGNLSGEEKRIALANARAVIVPSIWWEPFGLVVYEAYEYGRPVLAARSGGLAEIVRDGVTGQLHEPANSHDLASQVLEMEQNSEHSVRWGLAGRSWLEKHASVEQWLEQFKKVLSHALRN